MPATRKSSRIRLASAISGPSPKKPRAPSSPESQIPTIQASDPATMTAAVTIAERLLPRDSIRSSLPLDYAIGAQPGDLGLAQGEHLAQDLVGVLAEHRR